MQSRGPSSNLGDERPKRGEQLSYLNDLATLRCELVVLRKERVISSWFVVRRSLLSTTCWITRARSEGTRTIPVLVLGVVGVSGVVGDVGVSGVVGVVVSLVLFVSLGDVIFNHDTDGNSVLCEP